jgi:hypothetical protein
MDFYHQDLRLARRTGAAAPAKSGSCWKKGWKIKILKIL